MNGTVTPQVAELLAGPLKSSPASNQPTVEGIRAAHAALTQELVGPGEPVHRVWDSVITVGETAVPLRWYVPSENTPKLLTVFIHGGGWVTGTLDTYDTLCRSLALHSDGIVVSVGYSLSPEAVFPAALDESTHVIQHAHRLAETFGYSPEQIAVAGDSAGGQLIAAALHRLAKANETMPDRAVFIYPTVDATMDNATIKSLADGYYLSAARMRWYWEQYAGTSPMDTPELSPLHSPYLAKFPRSFVLTAEFDLLSGEGREFAERMTAAGVSVEHLEVPGQIHGFLRLRKVLSDPLWGADAVVERIGAFLRSR